MSDTGIICVRTDLPFPPVDRKEILRYAGAGTPTDEVNALLDECLSEVEVAVQQKICYKTFAVTPLEDGVLLGDTAIVSQNLKTALADCRTAVLFAATVGLGIDRLIAKYSRISPAKAFLIEAIGNERIEAVCDRFQQEFGATKPRFSPGYGDLPLDFQRTVFALLDCPRKIGVTLNESLLMTPVKSVTALFGIKE